MTTSDPATNIHRILIVDDQENVHEDLEQILLHHSEAPVPSPTFEEAVLGERPVQNRPNASVRFRVDHAYDGEEAIARVDDAAAKEYPYSVIFMDIFLSSEENGIGVVSRIWEKHPDIEVVLCTAHSEFALSDIIATLGMTDQLLYVRKPFDATSIVQMALALTRKCALHRKSETYIEDLRKTNEELAKEKENSETASRAKTDFLANMSHELRTPMHAILSFSKFGMRKISQSSPEKLRHYFSQINLAGGRLLNLLNDLMDLSRLESGKMIYRIESHDIKDILSATLEEFGNDIAEKGIRINVANTEVRLAVDCDKHKIAQVLRNLLSNAVKYTPEGKKVEITFEHSGFVDAYEKMTEGLTVKVRDEGIGIPDEELTAVFDKFIQSSKTKTGAGGTGLGLAICQEIIKAHGGKIWAEHNPEGGAILAFTLPYYR